RRNSTALWVFGPILSVLMVDSLSSVGSTKAALSALFVGGWLFGSPTRSGSRGGRRRAAAAHHGADGARGRRQLRGADGAAPRREAQGPEQRPVLDGGPGDGAPLEVPGPHGLGGELFTAHGDSRHGASGLDLPEPRQQRPRLGRPLRGEP